ncbi:hypothetical protein VNO78_06700 [Psophocarpus tetragonolobus]|uniref:Uncharacterized protein n=1 Tax=Psophocarpus tetragonolobus TaxID=3891 RepID=A0AAN9STI8_PSOTE
MTLALTQISLPFRVYEGELATATLIIADSDVTAKEKVGVAPEEGYGGDTVGVMAELVREDVGGEIEENETILDFYFVNCWINHESNGDLFRSNYSMDSSCTCTRYSRAKFSYKLLRR